MIHNEVLEETLTWDEVKLNIALWNSIKCFPEPLKKIFEGNLHFKFNAAAVLNQPYTKLHFYPAVAENNLVLYIIRKEDDKRSVYEKNEKNFVNKIITAKLEQPNSSSSSDEENSEIHHDIISGITAGEAIERIGNWITYHKRWIDEKVQSDGVFQAFSLDASDRGLFDELLGYFGLKGTANPFNFSADLILLNTENDFFNTVRPVPPYPPEVEADFFLLEAALGK